MPTLAGEVFVPAKLAEQLSSTEALGMESPTPHSRAEPRAAARLPDVAISAMGKGSGNRR